MRSHHAHHVVPNATRASFCARKFTSFVDFEHEKDAERVRSVRIEVALEPGRRAIERVVSGRRTHHATIAYERLCQPRVGTSRSSSPRHALTIHDSRPCRSALRNLDPGIVKIVFTLAWDYHTLKEPEDVERAVDADTGLLSDADPDVSRSFKRDVRHPPQQPKTGGRKGIYF